MADGKSTGTNDEWFFIPRGLKDLFLPKNIGPRILDCEAFLQELAEDANWTKPNENGMMEVYLSKSGLEYVSSGYGYHASTLDPDNCVWRRYFGRRQRFLRRECTVKVKDVTIFVLPKLIVLECLECFDGFDSDYERLKSSNCRYVITDVEIWPLDDFGIGTKQIKDARYREYLEREGWCLCAD